MTPTSPRIARVAGVSADWLARFDGSDLPDLQLRCTEADAAAAVRCADLVDRAHDAVPTCPSGLRRRLLALKRDAHNRRPLTKHARLFARDDADAPGLTDDAHRDLRDAFAVARDAQERAAAAHATLARRHDAVRADERRALAEAVDIPALHRGIAVASPLLAGKLDRLRSAQPDDDNRRIRRLRTSTLRYLSRAAAKLSPYATFTRVGLARVETTAPYGTPVVLHDDSDGWRHAHQVRLKRYWVDRVLDLLPRHPPLRRTLAVGLNPTIQPVDRGADGRPRFRYLRREYYAPDSEQQALAFFAAAVVTAPIALPWLSGLRRHLAAGPLTIDTLLDQLADVPRADAGDDADPGAIEQALVWLLHIGFLEVHWPFPLHHPRVEVALAHDLATRPDTCGVEALADALARLVRAQDALPEAPEPAQAIERVYREAERAWSALTTRVALPGLAPEADARGALYQDVVVAPAAPAETPCVATVCATRASAIVDAVTPLLQISHLFHLRHDLQLALGGLLAQRRPRCTAMPALDFFRAAQPVWRAFERHEKGLRPRRDPTTTRFDPFDLPQAQALHVARIGVAARLRETLTVDERGCHIDVDALRDALDALPPWMTCSGPGSAFVQPLDDTGERWVLNHLFEGTGRYASRYVATFPGDANRALRDALFALSPQRAYGLAEAPETGVPTELLDLFFVGGDTLNVRRPQTPWRLVIPGSPPPLHPDPVDAEASRDLHLDALRIRFRPAHGDRLPHLVGPGERLLHPVHLGGSGIDFMPSTIRFLSWFGSGDLVLTMPARYLPRDVLQQHADGVHGTLPVFCGPLMIRRPWWRVPRALFDACRSHDRPADGWRALQALCARYGIPPQVYRIERDGNTSRPQYLDLRSPSFAELLHQGDDPDGNEVRLSAALPAPDAYPRDRAGAGRAWAFEAQLFVPQPAPGAHPSR
ncbi:MAG: lantibiotic dehydratase [Acidobacteriota bacterium]